MFLGNWKTLADMEGDYEFDFKEKHPRGRVLLAWYGNGDYCGASFVLFTEDGKFYTDESSHCSCNGLEGSWRPTEVQPEELAGYVISDSYTGAGDCQAALAEVVEDILCPDEQVREVRRVLQNADVKRVFGEHEDITLRQAELERAQNILAQQYPEVKLDWFVSPSGSAYLAVRKVVH